MLVKIKSVVSSSKYSELVIRVFSRLDDLYSNTSLFSPSSTQALLFWSSGTFLMIIDQNDFFLMGSSMVSYLFCSLPCTLAKEVELFPGLGLYSGILAMYFQCQLNKSTERKTTIVSYAVCLLYVMSTVNFVSDLFALILEVSNNSICSRLSFF